MLTAILSIMMFFMIDTLGRIKEIAGEGTMQVCLQKWFGVSNTGHAAGWAGISQRLSEASQASGPRKRYEGLCDGSHVI